MDSALRSSTMLSRRNASTSARVTESYTSGKRKGSKPRNAPSATDTAMFSKLLSARSVEPKLARRSC